MYDYEKYSPDHSQHYDIAGKLHNACDDCQIIAVKEGFLKPCDRFDFVTNQPCALGKGHKDISFLSWHRLEDGTAFAIGYTAEDAAEWEAQ